MDSHQTYYWNSEGLVISTSLQYAWPRQKILLLNSSSRGSIKQELHKTVDQKLSIVETVILF